MTYAEGLEKTKEYGLDGIMVGRGIFHNPWFFDPSAPSCAGLIQRAVAAGWDWKPPPHLAEADELLYARKRADKEAARTSAESASKLPDTLTSERK